MVMNRHVPILLLASLTASCGRSDEQRVQPAASDEAAVPRNADPAKAPAGAAASQQATETPPSGTSAEAATETPPISTSAEAAADVLKTYYRLIEAGRYDEAWRLRWESEGGDATDFAAHFSDYAEYHATVGNPSEVQGAAGSSYVEVPVQLYGQMKGGESFGSAGTVTLRRVNDVPGATAAQRRWRIYTSE
jgi:hypothetical protein